jgi:putative copper export protein
MSANPQYDGILSINSQWASALLAKHIAIVLMVFVAALQTWVIQPRINRLMLRIAQSKADSMDIEPLLRRQKVLTRANFVFALVVLVFTAIARSS